ncbi:Dirigent protein [Hordeum vulgare]|nr:Dirigent protein [Hordeum vulgare]
MASYDVTPYNGASVENTKIHFKKLYLRQNTSGPNSNQSKLIDGDVGSEFGRTAVTNWAIHDGPSLDAKVVARARGLHVNAVDDHSSFTMVFESKRFKCSTLEIMGATALGQGDWAIIGGTGQFAMARGVVQRFVYERSDHGQVVELAIEAFCRAKLPWTRGEDGPMALLAGFKPQYDKLNPSPALPGGSKFKPNTGPIGFKPNKPKPDPALPTGSKVKPKTNPIGFAIPPGIKRKYDKPKPKA